MARLGSRRLLHAAVALTMVTMLLVPQAAAVPVAVPPEGQLPIEDVPPGEKGVESRPPQYADGEILVRFAPAIAGTAAVDRINARLGGDSEEPYASIPGLQLVRVPEGMSVEEAVEAYSQVPGVLTAQPNYRYELADVPNDPLFGRLWGLNNTGQALGGSSGTPDADIDAPEAWSLETGSSNVLVAVVDTGVDYNHPELADKIWVNPDEVAGNGLDDDGNGYIDDVHGIDAGSKDADPMDSEGHGTHVAGTIGAEANNAESVAGVAWDVTIMPVRISDSAGSIYTSYGLRAFEYVRAEGARIVNCSWGGILSDAAMLSLIQASPDQLFVCAAGNSAVDMETGSKFYPACYDSPNVISVGASDWNDAKASFSNYGATQADLFAPGANITSTVPGTGYLSPNAESTSTVLLAEDFATTNGWSIAASGPGLPGWALDNSHRRSEQSSLGVSGYGDAEVRYADGLAPLDLTTAASPWLEFYLELDTEAGYDWVSWGLVDTASDPDTYVELGRDSGWSDGKFEHHRVDLSDFAGTSNWRLRFTFSSDAAVNSADGYMGAWLDDVKVSDVSASEMTIYTNPIQYASAMAATVDWSTARTYTAWAYSASQADWYYATSQATENTWLFLKNPLNLASGPAELSFDAQYSLPLTYGRIDALRVYASGDNIWDTRATSGNTLLGSFSGTSGEAKRTVSLADFAGDDSVWIAFQLVTAMATHPVSARIDDIVVTGEGWQPGVDYTYSYQAWSGTSMAAPHVSGTAALLLAHQPALTTQQLRTTLLGTVDTKDALSGTCVTGGRLNAFSALDSLNVPPVAVDDSYTTPRETPLRVSVAEGLFANDYDPAPARLPFVYAPIDTSEAHGSVELTFDPYPDGSFTYTPDPGFVGEAWFTYAITDAGGLISAPATVRITVTPPVLTNVYRFYNRLSGSHFYTTSASERAMVNARWPATYEDEGVAYQLDPLRNSTPLHRFFNLRNGSHFYTASAEEAARVAASMSDAYAYEGTAYMVSLTGGPSSLAVHRFFNRRNGSHFYTASEAERDMVIDRLRDTYAYEGVAFYVTQ